jgi:hypothetical protein
MSYAFLHNVEVHHGDPMPSFIVSPLQGINSHEVGFRHQLCTCVSNIALTWEGIFKWTNYMSSSGKCDICRPGCQNQCDMPFLHWLSCWH